MDTTKRESKILPLVIYIMQFLAIFNGLTAIVAVFISYIKVDDPLESDWIRDHYRWQIRTFWMWLLLTAVGFLTIIILIGYAILFLTQVWFIYRIVKGLIRLHDGQSI